MWNHVIIRRSLAALGMTSEMLHRIKSKSMPWDVLIMQPITRDIQLTLVIKLLLLFVLWFVCFHGAGKNSVDMAQWLYGAGDNKPGVSLSGPR